MKKKNRRRADRIGIFVDPLPRFLAAMAALPGFLMIESILWRGIFVLFFAVLALAAGKRIQWLYFLVFTTSIVWFHLLTPTGKVLMEIGPFAVTDGGLRNGLIRGTGLVGIVFLSIAAIRPELEIPGQLGGILGRTFYYFDLIIEGRNQISLKDFFASLDRVLLNTFHFSENDFISEVQKSRNNKYRGLGWAVSAALLPWIVWGVTSRN